MPRQTLLEMTQDILSEVSGDYTNSISDTDESEQIAQIIRSTYWEIIESRVPSWPHLKRTITIDSASDSTKPTHMRLNTDIYMLHNLLYNKRKDGAERDDYQTVKYCPPDEFLELCNARNETLSNYTQITDFGGAAITIRNDVAPTWYTTFDDDYFVFDSYDSAVDSTLRSSKTQAIVSAVPTWTHEDSFVPDLPQQAFSMLLEESRSVVWNSLKQLPNQKAEQRSQRQRRNVNLNAHRINSGIKQTPIGRRSRK